MKRRMVSQDKIITTEASSLVVEPEALSPVDELLTRMTQEGTFTGAVLIAQHRKVLFSKGYGLADRALGITNTPQTRFHLGSITKQFTAMVILILQSQGKLSVQDPICNFIAGCPKEWQDMAGYHHPSPVDTHLGIVKSAVRPTLSKNGGCYKRPGGPG